MRHGIALAFILLLVSGVASYAQAPGVGTGSYTSCSSITLPRDSNGWSIFTSPTTGSIYYISTNDGNDNNSGKSSVPNPLNTGGVGAAGPWKTIAKAVAQAATDTGKDSWFLFKKGDVFLDQAIGVVNANGKDCAHPMLWSSYDPAQPGVADPYGNVAIASISCSATTATVTTSSAHGWTNGNPYQLVLTKELPAGFNAEVSATITGTTTFTYTVSSCPAASDSSHGIVSLSRPVIKIKPSVGTVCLPDDTGGSTGDFFAMVGLYCWAYTIDPYSPSFSKTDFQASMNAASLMGAATNFSSHTWRLYEDNKFVGFTQGVLETPNEAGNTISYYLEMSRNVSYHTFGNYIDGVAHVLVRDNINLINDWDPALTAGQSVSITTGATGIITQAANNFYISGSLCSTVQFTASVMPTGLSAGTTYYVINVSGNQFSVDSTDCTGAHPVAISTTGTSVLAYWYGQNGSGCGQACAYPQVSVFTHAWYLQDAQYVGATWDANMLGNTVALIAGAACECGNNGTMFNNLYFQNSYNFTEGKGSPPAWSTSLHWDVLYNGVFELAPQYFSPSTNVVLNGIGISLNSSVGSAKYAHNLIAYEVPLNSSNGTGLGTNQGGITGATFSNNLSCGIGTPIRNDGGSIISASVTTPGTLYTPTTASTTYQNSGSSIYLVPLTGGHGVGASGTVTVGGGVVTGFTIVNGGTGPGFKIGDVLSIPNQYIGGTGSGGGITVTAVDGPGKITSFTVNGGSGYSSAYDLNTIATTSGSGVNNTELFRIAIANGGSTMTGIYPNFGQTYNFNVGDTITFANTNLGGTGSGAVGTVTAVTTNTYTNNTYKTGNCNNLASATGSLNGLPASVALPTANASPPTDVIGSYFASLSYGYTDAVPGILSGQASASEMGYVKAASLQQKSNWDTNLTAPNVLNWARPQFGMSNP